MLSYSLKFRKSTGSKNPKGLKTKILLSKCEVYDSKKLEFIKEQEASGLLSCLGLKIPLSEVPLGPLLF